MISGKAVAIWMLLAIISAFIIRVLRRRCDSRQQRRGRQTDHSHQRCDSNPDEIKGGIGKDGMGKSGRCERTRCEIKSCDSWYAVIPILVFYIAFVLTITIIERTPGNQMKYNLELFWTVREIINGRRELISEIFWNVVLFVPIGVLMSIVLLGKAERCERGEQQQKPYKLCGSGKNECGLSHSVWRLTNTMWIVILIGFLFSTGIEVTQLLTYRGLFEFDDIFYNTLGTAIGVAALHAVRSRQRSHPRHHRLSFFT